MADIVPRWEWRTFARRIRLEHDLGAYPRTRHVVTSEIYLDAEPCEDNPKIRDGSIDIKRLREVDDHGLEQWRPVMKAAFPLAVEQVRDVCRTLGVAPPPGEQQRIGLDPFLALLTRDGTVRAVQVEKIRDLYDVGGGTVEFADVTFEGEGYQTFAVEDADPATVLATRERFGFAGHDNINYVKAIRTLVRLA